MLLLLWKVSPLKALSLNQQSSYFLVYMQAEQDDIWQDTFTGNVF